MMKKAWSGLWIGVAIAAIIAMMAVAEGQFDEATGIEDCSAPEGFSPAICRPQFERPRSPYIPIAAGRDPAQVRAFRKARPCPATGKTSGACPGWVVDHIIPLCWGGPDDPSNMQWQERAASYLKDKFERAACAMKKKSGGNK